MLKIHDKSLLLSLLIVLILAACEPPSEREPAVSLPPEAPTAPSITAADSQVTVDWNPVTDADTYEVWYGTANDTGSAQQWGTDTAETTALITGLTNNVPVFIWIRAKNSQGTSGFSPSGTGTPVAPTLPPAAPAAPVLTAGNTIIEVSWSPVAGATAYEVWYGTTDDSAAALQWGPDLSVTVATLTGLINGTSIYVWIRAENSVGTGAFSPSASETPEEEVTPPALDPPNGITVTPGNTVLTVSWNAVTGADTYEIWINTVDNSAGASKRGSDVSDTSVILTSLANGTPYWVWIKAKNSTQTSGFSAAGSGAPEEPAPESLVLTEAETLTASGSYAGSIDSPFNGMALYANNDAIQGSFNFPTIPGLYRLDIRGASNNSNAAKASVYLDTVKIGEASFTGTTATVFSLSFAVDSGTPGNRTVKIVCEADTGAWDIYIDSIELFYLGEPAPPPDPFVVPSEPVWNSRQYRNLFAEIGKSEAEIQAKVNGAFDQLFYGTETQKIYYEKTGDSTMAYILDVNNNDVRSEGMSYGMMFCVQLDKQEEFDKLWKFAKTHMQHASGARQGYFAWQVNTDGTIKDNNSAPDGEEYFAMALYFAWKRWGNGTGIYNYQAEADNILNHMINHRTLVGLQTWDGSSENMIALNNSNGRATAKQVVFVPYGSSADHTDPSYHLPHFYELWALWAPRDNDLWGEIAAESRTLFQNACHPSTGLAPDYSQFDGTPTGGEHADFRYDAWRVAMNIAMDSVWWNKDSWQRDTWVDTYLGFFESKGITSHGSLFKLDGTSINADHSPGLVAMNAVAALLSDDPEAWRYVEELWDISTTTGQYRYFDGCLYMFGMLAVSGNYRIWD